MGTHGSISVHGYQASGEPRRPWAPGVPGFPMGAIYPLACQHACAHKRSSAAVLRNIEEVHMELRRWFTLTMHATPEEVRYIASCIEVGNEKGYADSDPGSSSEPEDGAAQRAGEHQDLLRQVAYTIEHKSLDTAQCGPDFFIPSEAMQKSLSAGLLFKPVEPG